MTTNLLVICSVEESSGASALTDAASEQIRELLEDLVIQPLIQRSASEPETDRRIDEVRALLATVAVIHEGALPTLPRAVVAKFEAFMGGGKSDSIAFKNLCKDMTILGVDDFTVDTDQNDTNDKDLIAVGKQVLESWLRECWCDAFGVRKTGLAFLYSQLHDFMFCCSVPVRWQPDVCALGAKISLRANIIHRATRRGDCAA
ncbi:MAG: hypothetical protein PHH58_12625 [Rhodoferax sp.]|nr:hypothetical protein [Rhodoferax sp.]